MPHDLPEMPRSRAEVYQAFRHVHYPANVALLQCALEVSLSDWTGCSVLLRDLPASTVGLPERVSVEVREWLRCDRAVRLSVDDMHESDETLLTLGESLWNADDSDRWAAFNVFHAATCLCAIVTWTTCWHAIGEFGVSAGVLPLSGVEVDPGEAICLCVVPTGGEPGARTVEWWEHWRRDWP